MELDYDEIMAKQVEQLEKEKRELLERLKNQERKVYYWLEKWFSSKRTNVLAECLASQ